ncbi:hypothetical protein ACIQPR_10475 [Streptomyces sp. NPDC091280]
MYGTMDTGSKVAIFLVVFLIVAGISVGIVRFRKSGKATKNSANGE